MSIADIVAKLHTYGVDATLIEEIVRLIVRPTNVEPAAYAAKLAYDKEYQRKRRELKQGILKVNNRTTSYDADNVLSSLPLEPLKEEFPVGDARAPAREVEEFFDAYNVCAKELGWTVAVKLNQQRRAAIKRAIKDAGDLEAAFDHLNGFANSRHGSQFGAGDNDREWKIGIDYVIRAGKWLEIMEGKFNGVQAKGQAVNGNNHDWQ